MLRSHLLKWKDYCTTTSSLKYATSHDQLEAEHRATWFEIMKNNKQISTTEIPFYQTISCSKLFNAFYRPCQLIRYCWLFDELIASCIIYQVCILWGAGWKISLCDMMMTCFEQDLQGEIFSKVAYLPPLMPCPMLYCLA